jgi:hypothetical protein
VASLWSMRCPSPNRFPAWLRWGSARAAKLNSALMHVLGCLGQPDIGDKSAGWPRRQHTMLDQAGRWRSCSLITPRARPLNAAQPVASHGHVNGQLVTHSFTSISHTAPLTNVCQLLTPTT